MSRIEDLALGERPRVADPARPRIDKAEAGAAMFDWFVARRVDPLPVFWVRDAREGFLKTWKRRPPSLRLPPVLPEGTDPDQSAARAAQEDAAASFPEPDRMERPEPPKNPPRPEALRRARAAGLWLYWDLETSILAAPRPALSIVGGRLHADGGPAVRWPGGAEYWFWNGIQVRPGSRAERVHADRTGELYRLASIDEGLEAVVKVINATPEADGSRKDHFLRVPPDVRTAREAVAWTFGMSAGAYRPLVET